MNLLGALVGIVLTIAFPLRAQLVNAGGPDFVDPTTNLHWAADTGFSGGTATSTTQPIVGNPSNAALYQTQRFGNFTYTFPIPPGNYILTLKFAESFWSAAGQRVFNVTANGQTILSNFDIFAAAGAQNKPIDRTFTVAANSTGIVLQFVTVTDNAAVNAIAITPSPITISSSLVSVELGPSQYCAARWSAPSVQLYCYTTVKTTWDTLIYNSIFSPSSAVYVPYVLPLDATGKPDLTRGILWTFRKDPVTNQVTWTVAWGGTAQQSGTFQ